MFRPIEAKDQKIFRSFIKEECFGSELCFANIFAWRNYDKLEIYYNDEMLIIKGREFFFPPLVKNIDYKIALDFIANYARINKFPFCIYGVTERFLPMLQIEGAQILPHPELDEYLYKASDLASYHGKKFAAKRNFFNQFSKIDYHFVAYNPLMKHEIYELIKQWSSEKETSYEAEGIFSLLDNLDLINCFCDCIIINNKVEAFAIGTVLKTVGIVLFEKANIEYPGIYAAIVKLVAEKRFSQVEYINRQEDMGLDNLRKSKMSYHPVGFVKKWRLSYTFDNQAKEIYNYQFSDSLEYIEYFFSPKKEKESHYLIENTILKSMFFSSDHSLQLNKESIKTKLLFTLATHPFYEGKGYMSKLLEKQMHKWYNEVDLIYLHPAINNFYNKFGFFPLDNLAYINDDLIINKDIKLEKIIDLYNKNIKNYNCFMHRDHLSWDSIIDELQITKGYIAYLEKDHKIVGYEIFDGVDIIEVVNPLAVKYQENNYARIINLAKIIRYTKFIPQISINVIDPIIPENNFVIKGRAKDIINLSIEKVSRLIFKNIKCFIPKRY